MNFNDSNALKKQVEALLSILNERGSEVLLPKTDLTLSAEYHDDGYNHVLSCVHYDSSIGEVTLAWAIHLTPDGDIERFALGNDSENDSVDAALDVTSFALSTLR